MEIPPADTGGVLWTDYLHKTNMQIIMMTSLGVILMRTLNVLPEILISNIDLHAGHMAGNSS